MPKAKMTFNRFNRLYGIEQEQTEDDSMGGKKTTGWSEIGTVWGKTPRPMNARERFFPGLATQRTTHEITIRYTTLIDQHHRLAWKGRVFEIVSIMDPDEKQLVLKVEVIEHGTNFG